MGNVYDNFELNLNLLLHPILRTSIVKTPPWNLTLEWKIIIYIYVLHQQQQLLNNFQDPYRKQRPLDQGQWTLNIFLKKFGKKKDLNGGKEVDSSSELVPCINWFIWSRTAPIVSPSFETFNTSTEGICKLSSSDGSNSFFSLAYSYL